MNQRSDQPVDKKDFNFIGGWIGPINDTPPCLPCLMELWRHKTEATDVIVMVNLDQSRTPIGVDVPVKQPAERFLATSAPYPIYDANVVMVEGMYLTKDSNIPTQMPDGRIVLAKDLPDTSTGVEYITR